MSTSQERGRAPGPPREGVVIRAATIAEVEELLPLMRAYCDFYEADPPDAGLLRMARALIGDPEQGALFIARGAGGEAVGFAAMDWKWSSLRGARVGYLEDLFVAPAARGGGIADALISACADRCRELGMPALQWLTAPDNHRAQAVYDRVGGRSKPFLEYALDVGESSEP
jgi:GNAT superfamily N-acetyltransferase